MMFKPEWLQLNIICLLLPVLQTWNMPVQQNIRKYDAVGWRDLMDSDYYCCHGEDVSRCLVALCGDERHTHACITHDVSQTKTTTLLWCWLVLVWVFLRIVWVNLSVFICIQACSPACVCVCAFIRCWLMTKIAESCSAGSTNRCHHTNTMVSMATVKIDSTFALRNSKGRCTNPREPPPPIITIPTDTDALKYQPHSEITSCHYIYKNIITAAYTNNLLKFKCTFCT